jgi:hypothetical protein
MIIGNQGKCKVQVTGEWERFCKASHRTRVIENTPASVNRWRFSCGLKNRKRDIGQILQGFAESVFNRNTVVPPLLRTPSRVWSSNDTPVNPSRCKITAIDTTKPSCMWRVAHNCDAMPTVSTRKITHACCFIACVARSGIKGEITGSDTGRKDARCVPWCVRRSSRDEAASLPEKDDMLRTMLPIQSECLWRSKTAISAGNKHRIEIARKHGKRHCEERSERAKECDTCARTEEHQHPDKALRGCCHDSAAIRLRTQPWTDTACASTRRSSRENSIHASTASPAHPWR